MLKTFSLISDIHKTNLTKELKCLLPHPPIMRPIILWIMLFLINFQSSNVSFRYWIFYAWMTIYIIVFMYYTASLYWFSDAFAYFQLTWMSRSTKCIMVDWNKANVCIVLNHCKIALGMQFFT